MTNAELQAARELLGEQYTSQSMAGMEAGYEKMLALLPKLLDEIEAMRPVVEAADLHEFWSRQFQDTGRVHHREEQIAAAMLLAGALDAYRSRKAMP